MKPLRLRALAAPGRARSGPAPSPAPLPSRTPHVQTSARLPHWPLPLKQEVHPALSDLADWHRAWMNTHALTGQGKLRVHEVVAYAIPSAPWEVLTLLTD